MKLQELHELQFLTASVVRWASIAHSFSCVRVGKNSILVLSRTHVHVDIQLLDVKDVLQRSFRQNAACAMLLVLL